ncbi:ParA family protein [Pseudomonas sp. PLMAX]|uniref:ParA family protein n=1 Tax=Pseudomonas sp. PLMAX TaxID=2201998 RepID=UPI0038BC1892
MNTTVPYEFKQTSVLMFANNKGGVGKTTTALNEAAALSEKGKSVIYLDFDDSTNSSFHIKVKGSSEKCFPISSFLTNPNLEIQDCILWGTKLNNVGLIPSDKGIKKALEAKAHGSDEEILKIVVRLRQALDSLDGTVDYIIIDASPTMDTAVKIALSVTTHLIFVVDGSSYSDQGVVNMMNSEEMEFVKKHNPNQAILGVLLNKIDTRTTVSRMKIDKPEIGGVKRINVYIPERKEVDNNTYTQEFVVGPGKNNLIADSYRELADFIIESTQHKEVA